MHCSCISHVLAPRLPCLPFLAPLHPLAADFGDAATALASAPPPSPLPPHPRPCSRIKGHPVSLTALLSFWIYLAVRLVLSLSLCASVCYLPRILFCYLLLVCFLSSLSLPASRSYHHPMMLYRGAPLILNFVIRLLYCPGLRFSSSMSLCACLFVHAGILPCFFVSISLPVSSFLPSYPFSLCPQTSYIYFITVLYDIGYT